MNIKTIIWLTAALSAGPLSAEGIALRSSQDLQPSLTMVTTPGGAAAATGSNSSSYATTTSQGGSAQGVGSQGQSLSIDSHDVYHAQPRIPVATAVAPALSSSNDTCMGSTSLGGSSVGFSFSVGSTWTDENCVMLKNAREIWNMGFKGAALARLCMDDRNKEALEATGIACPTRSNKAAQSAQTASATTQPTVVGSNNGMPDPYAY